VSLKEKFGSGSNPKKGQVQARLSRAFTWTDVLSFMAALILAGHYSKDMLRGVVLATC
jgi:hypothetical protein